MKDLKLSKKLLKVVLQKETEALELGSYTEEKPYIWWHGLSSAIEQLTANGVLKY